MANKKQNPPPPKAGAASQERIDHLKPNNIFLSSNLKFLRKNHGGLTQHELADKTGVLRSAIAGYERGGMLPRVDYIFTLSRFFEVPIEAMLLKDLETASNETKADPKPTEQLPEKTTGIESQDTLHKKIIDLQDKLIASLQAKLK